MITQKGMSEWVGEFETFSPFENIVRVRLSDHVITQNLKQYDGVLILEDIGLRKAVERQVNAIYQLFNLKAVNKTLLHLLSNPSQITSGTKHQISQWLQNTVGTSDSQSEAVKLSLGTRELFLLQGPPGTGKTTVIAELVLQIISNNPKARILITSQSHVAVDNALEKIRDLAKGLPEDAITRIGKANKVKIPALLLENHLKSWRDQIIEETSKNIIDNESVGNALQQPDGQIAQLLKDWQDEITDHYDELSSPYFSDICNVVGATCIGFAGNHIASELEFDWVIVDEAGRATFPETLVPIVQGRRIVLVGDHYQLPPTITESLKKASKSKVFEDSDIDEAFMQTSLFEYLFTSLEKEPDRVAPIHMRLFRQYRMHPNIGCLISECFYDKGLKNAENTSERLHGLLYESKPISSVIWFNTTEKKNCYEIEKYDDGKIAGYYNEAEIAIVSDFLVLLNRWYTNMNLSKSIGIITAYSVQAQQLHRRLPRKQLKAFYDIEVDTVDAYQGRDRDIIIYSIVRSSSEMELGQARKKNGRSTLGFLRDDNGGMNRINVALSRARELLVIVGNKEVVRIENNNPLGRVAQYIKSRSQWEYPMFGLRGIHYISEPVEEIGDGDLDGYEY